MKTTFASAKEEKKALTKAELLPNVLYRHNCARLNCVAIKSLDGEIISIGADTACVLSDTDYTFELLPSGSTVVLEQD